MARVNPVYKICKECGESFSTLRPKVKYCSEGCMRSGHGKWVKENQSGSNNPFYGKTHTEESLAKMKGPRPETIPHNKGKRNGRYYVASANRGYKWRFISSRIKERDGFRCQYCGGHGEVVHHIIPLLDCQEHKDNNLITLCHSCHYMTYKREYEFVDYFKGVVSFYYANGGSPVVDNPVALFEGARD